MAHGYAYRHQHAHAHQYAYAAPLAYAHANRRNAERELPHHDWENPARGYGRHTISDEKAVVFYPKRRGKWRKRELIHHHDCADAHCRCHANGLHPHDGACDLHPIERDSQRYAHAQRYANGNAHSDGNADRNRNRNRNGNAYSDRHPHIYPNGDPFAMNAMRTKYISIIIPAHNEERRLRQCLNTVIQYVDRKFPYSWEVVIVENGSTDSTWQIAQEYAGAYQHVHALQSGERGKGAAVKRGMLYATSKWRYMADVDLSAPISELNAMLSVARSENVDIVIGSREMFPAGVETTFSRRMIGRIFHALAGSLTPTISDTQCGFKLFGAQAASRIFDAVTIPGMAFDVEALYIAERLGYEIAQYPIHWKHDPDSRVRFVSDSLQMARDVLSIPVIHARSSVIARER